MRMIEWRGKAGVPAGMVDAAMRQCAEPIASLATSMGRQIWWREQKDLPRRFRAKTSSGRRLRQGGTGGCRHVAPALLLC